MKIIIASRQGQQFAFALQLKITFKCCVCEKEVEPEEIQIGKAHVYALHCDQLQDVGLVA